MGKENSNKNITSLSDEMMLYIFEDLSPKDLAAAALVCKKWDQLTNDDQLWRKWLREQRSNSIFKENVTSTKQLIKKASIVYIVGQPIRCTRPLKLSEFYSQPLSRISEEQLKTSFKSDEQDQEYPIFETESDAKRFINATNMAQGGWIDKYPVIAKACIKLRAPIKNQAIAVNPIIIKGVEEADNTPFHLIQEAWENKTQNSFPHIHETDIAKFYSLKLEVNNKIYQHIYEPEQPKSRCILQ